MHTVTSQDGTRIAYECRGHGPLVVLVAPALHDHRLGLPLAEELAGEYTVISYDRRGRGASGDTAPYAVEREIEDLAALITAEGTAAAIYGHSSGGGLALHAAAHHLPVSKLVVHDPPYGPDSEDHRRGARAIAEEVNNLLSQGLRREAVASFLLAAGMPHEAAQQTSQDPALESMAPTLAYDLAVMGNLEHGGAVPTQLLRRIAVPTLVLNGGESPQFMSESGRQIASSLPDGHQEILDGQEHFVPAADLAPRIAQFLRT